MTGPDTRALITADVEERILEILDATEPGDSREAALRALNLSESMRTAVQVWLAEEAAEDDSDSFLQTPVSGTVLESSSTALPRRQGNYELWRVLGKGGMGIVYEAKDLRLGRTVALKVLPEHFADNPKRLQRFEREVRAIAALRHPAIVSVYEAGTLDRTPFFTMELVSGSSLDKIIHRLRSTNTGVSELRRRDWLEVTAMTESDRPGEGRDRPYVEPACQLIIDIADALQHAHDQKVIHRDVKPSNIMISSSGDAKLFDFGLARLEDEGVVTRTSELVGSPHYMSPEQVSAKELDHRTDVYSLGVTLYELLTLDVPFAGSTPQQIYHSIVNVDPPRPGLANPALPRDLETICLTATDKRPDRRYQTAFEFADDLRRFLRFEPVLARPIGSLTRSVRWLRRNLATATIAVLGFTTIVAVLVILAEKLSMAEDRAAFGQDLEAAVEKQTLAETRAEDAAKRTKKANEESRAAAQKTRDAEIKTRDAETKTAAADEKTRTARDKADELNRKITALEERSRRTKDEVDKLNQDKEKFADQIEAQKKNLQQMRDEITATKTELGSLEANHKVTTIHRLLMEASTLRMDNPGLGFILAREAAQRADGLGPELVLRRDVDLQARVDDALLEMLGACQERLTFTAHNHTLTAVAFAPSGDRIVSASTNGTVYIWDRATKRIHKSTNQSTSIVHLEFLDDRDVLLANEAGAIFLWDTNSDGDPRPQRSLRHDSSIRTHVGPDHEDGRYLVAHSRDRPGELAYVKLDSQSQPRSLGGPTRFRAFVFRPDGGGIGGITTETKQRNQVVVYEFGVAEPVLEQDCDANPLAIAFDTSGRRLAWLEEDGSVRIVNVRDGVRFLDVKVNDGYLLGTGQIAFCDEDRHLLVTGTAARAHYLISANTGHVIAKIPCADDRREFTLSPNDGKLACIATESGGFYLIHTANGRVVTRLNGHRFVTARHPPRVAFSPVGDAVATVYGDKAVRIWSTAPGGWLTTLGPGVSDLNREVSTDTFLSGRFESDGVHVLIRSRNGVSRWNLLSGQRTHQLVQDRQIPTSDQQLDATGAGAICYQDGAIKRLPEGRAPLRRVPPAKPGFQLDHVALWPAGQLAMSYSTSGSSSQAVQRVLHVLGRASKGEIRIELPPGLRGGGVPTPSAAGDRFFIGYNDLWLYETRAGARGIHLPFSQRPAAFAPSGRTLATSSGFSVKIWDARTGQFRFKLKGLPNDYSQLTSLSYSPDGKQIATAWTDGWIRVHDTDPGSTRKPVEIAAHRLRIRSLGFSADGKTLLSASDDGTVGLWYSADGHRRLSFNPGVACRFACFDQAAEFVLVVCDETLHVFPLAVRSLAKTPRLRELTATERSRFGL